MGHIIASVASHFSTQFDFDQVQAFFADKDVGAGKLVLRQTLEQIQVQFTFSNIADFPFNLLQFPLKKVNIAHFLLKKVNIEFRRQSEKGVDAWLDHHFPPAAPTSQ